MQEFRPEDNIEKIIRMIQHTFTNQHPPQNALQQQLVDAARLVNNRIQTYWTQATSNGRPPFCLRFPTLEDVIQRSMDLELKCEVLPADVMVIFFDEGGICVGIGLPPKPESNTTHHLPRDLWAQQSLDNFLCEQ
ncbi:hypothetical protein PCANC_28102 [Puccinia coronata f. sp. avenae]|uniref:Uncharacterized protein n=1 Tax=Puccinia coronata f. sp. avenae TaxID=200324 RepID=A0A2N5TN42_9BASI|nr:hypothetical protein PCANC_28102 [Puccinia coronata f. sp. avenae]